VPTTSPTVQDLTPRSRIKVLWASLIGTSLESYDFYVFSYLSALFIGPLFFEPLGGFGGVLAAFLANALGFVARPLGAIVFGHLGDRIGRRNTLILTITIMGVATGLIGVLPTFAQAGWVGGVLLVTLRLIQGFSLGGEWGGGILLATEFSGPKRHAFYAAFPQLGSPIGSIITALLFIGLPAGLGFDAFLEWGWRIPFLAAFVFLAVSLWLRLTIDETPVFKAVLAQDKRERVPLATLFRTKPVALVLGTGAALLGIGSYSLMNTYTLNYGAAELGFAYNDLLFATTIGGLLQLVTIPLFGALTSKIIA
jgi:MFS family permease